jgi:ribosomal protein S18 acetylase RimI-like enzyme
VNVRLIGVTADALDDFLAAFDDYRHELAAYSASPDTLPIERYGDALRADPEDQELMWIEVDGERAGFLLVRLFEDWPDTTQAVLDIAECYIAPAFRRRGAGKAAIAALLNRERARGTALIEASVLSRNESALAFWEALGFTTRSIRTAREP